MKAVGYQNSLPLTDPASLLDIEMEQPTLRDRDLLIEVKAVSVNPVDTKVRRSAKPDEGQKYKVLGYDGAGIVRQVGEPAMAAVLDLVLHRLQRMGSCSDGSVPMIDIKVADRRKPGSCPRCS